MCLNAIGKQEIKTELPDANAVDTTNAEAPATKVLQPESGLGPSAEALTEQQSGALPTEETTGRTKVDGLSPTAGLYIVQIKVKSTQCEMGWKVEGIGRTQPSAEQLNSNKVKLGYKPIAVA